MSQDTKWKPNDFQIGWLKTMIAMTRAGGVWGQSIGIFTLDKKTKTASFIPSGIPPGEIIGDIPADEMYRRNVTTFKTIGWTVKGPAIVDGSNN